MSPLARAAATTDTSRWAPGASTTSVVAGENVILPAALESASRNDTA